MITHPIVIRLRHTSLMTISYHNVPKYSAKALLSIMMKAKTPNYCSQPFLFLFAKDIANFILMSSDEKSCFSSILENYFSLEIFQGSTRRLLHVDECAFCDEQILMVSDFHLLRIASTSM